MPKTVALTPQEEAFAQEFATIRVLRRAYMAAYPHRGVTERQIYNCAREVYDRPHVQERIKELIDLAAKPVTTQITEVLERFLLIASADPGELMSIKTGCCRYCHGDKHLYQWKEREYLEAMDRADAENEREQELANLTGKPPKTHPYPDPLGGFGFDHTLPPHADCPECRGEGVMRILVKDTDSLSPGGLALYGGVKQTANGLEVKMADQVKALETVGKILGAFKDDTPKRLQVELRGMTAVVKTEAKDPQEAARMYQDMIAGKLS